MPHDQGLESNGHDDPENLYRRFAGMDGLRQLRSLLIAYSGLMRLWRRLQRQSPELAASGYDPSSLVEWVFRATRNDPPGKLQKRLAEVERLEHEADTRRREIEQLQAATVGTPALWQAATILWAFVHLFRGVSGALRSDGTWYRPTDRDLPHYASGGQFAHTRRIAAHEFALSLDNALQAMVGPLATSADRLSLEGARAHWWKICQTGVPDNPPSRP